MFNKLYNPTTGLIDIISPDGSNSVLRNNTTDTNLSIEGILGITDKVGIRNTSPDVALHLGGANPEIRLEENAGTYAYLLNVTSDLTRFGHYSASGQALLDIDANPASGTDTANIRLFRNINTTAGAALVVCRANGTFDANHQLGANIGSFLNTLIGDVSIGSLTNPAELLLPNTASRIGVGTTSPAVAFHASGGVNPGIRLEEVAGSYGELLNLSQFRTGLRHFAATGFSVISIDPLTPTDELSEVRFFSEVDTTSSASLQVHRANGAYNPNHTIAGNGNSTLQALVGDVTLGSATNAADLLMQTGAGIGIGTTSPATAIHVRGGVNPELRLEEVAGSPASFIDIDAASARLQKSIASGAAGNGAIYLDIPTVDNRAVLVSLFQATTTALQASLVINNASGTFAPNLFFRGNSGSNLQMLIGDVTLGSATNAADLIMQTGAGIGIGTTSPATAIHVRGGSNPSVRLEEVAGSYIELRNFSANSSTLNHLSLTGDALIAVNSQPLDNVGAAQITMFRDTNTTGPRQVEFFKGNGTSTVQHQLSLSDNSNLCVDTGDLFLGSASNPADLIGRSGAEIKSFGSISLAERSSAVATNAGQGAIWAKNTSNENQLAVTRGSGIVESIDGFSQEAVIGTNPSGDATTGITIARWAKKWAILTAAASTRVFDLPSVYGGVNPANFAAGNNSHPVLCVNVRVCYARPDCGDLISDEADLYFSAPANVWTFRRQDPFPASVISGSMNGSLPRVSLNLGGSSAETIKVLVEMEAVATA